MTVDVAVIGTGSKTETFPEGGFAMGYIHADAYERLDDCRLVGAADVVPENAEAFAAAYGLDDGQVFEDYREMLAAVEPDVVSVCTPPATHADIVVGCAERGVEAIHCEKPMALTWGGSRRMVGTCEREGVQLTFNHMRRFADVFRGAKRRLDAGAIGDLRRVEYTWGDFYDCGSHAIDLCNYFNDEHAAEWVIGQLDYRHRDVRFGAHQENQVFATWEYDNGVFGMASTGRGAGLDAGDWRLVGTAGEMEVTIVDEVRLDVRPVDGDPETVSWDGLAEGPENCHDRAVADAVRAVRTGDTTESCAANALTATEIIFAGYESVRRRGRVDLPLTIDDNPLEAMVDAGLISPTAPDAELQAGD
jgi:predicted dehydrogenase